MNSRVLLLIVGLLAGGLVGWVTRPAATEGKPWSATRGKCKVTIPLGAQETGPLTNGQIEHIAIYTVLGGVIGALAGMLVIQRDRVS